MEKFELLVDLPEERREMLLDYYDNASDSTRVPCVFIIYKEGSGFTMIPNVK